MRFIEPWPLFIAYDEHTTPHVNKDDKRLVAFYERPSRKEKGITTTTTPGRYLTRYWSHVLTPDQIRYLAEAYITWAVPPTLELATTAEEISWVFQNGPRSCMSHHLAHFHSGGMHPTEVYATGDLAVAYVKLKEKENVSARVIVAPERKIYFGKIYGTRTILIPALEDAGYRNASPEKFNGLRLRRTPHPTDPNYMVVPYVDFARLAVDKDDGYLHIGVKPKQGEDSYFLQTPRGAAPRANVEIKGCRFCNDHYPIVKGGACKACMLNHFCYSCEGRSNLAAHMSVKVYGLHFTAIACAQCIRNGLVISCKSCSAYILKDETNCPHCNANLKD